MSTTLRTEVHFRSAAFNTSEPKGYFINPCCYGDDLCRWLIQQLRNRGYRTADEPGQEDFGWYFTFHVLDTEYCFVVGYQEGDNPGDGLWRGWLERQAAVVASLFGGRNKGIMPEAAEAIHRILANSEAIRDVTWHFAHDPNDESHGAPQPTD